MKRKFIIISLSLLIASSFTGCNIKSEDTSATDTTTVTATNTPEINNSEPTPTPTDSSNESNINADSETVEVINNDVDTVMRESRLFYFNSNDYKLYYIDKKIPVKENAYVKALTDCLQKSPDSANLLALTDEVNITSASLNYETGVLKIVFDKDYSDIMALEDSNESGLLYSLINTYGYNYDVDKVAIYFGDTLYTALSGELPEGYFNVTLENAVEYNKN